MGFKFSGQLEWGNISRVVEVTFRLKIPKALYDLEKSARPTDTAELIGETPMITGEILSEPGKSGLTEKLDKKQPL